MGLVGYPWTNGGSLIAQELSDCVSHTTLRLHCESDYTDIGIVGAGGENYHTFGNTTFLPLGSTPTAHRNFSFALNPTLPATGSWSVNLYAEIGHYPDSSNGSSVFRPYFNGAYSSENPSWSTTTVNQAVSGDVRGVGTGTIWLYAANELVTGSAAVDIFKCRIKQVSVFPI